MKSEMENSLPDLLSVLNVLVKSSQHFSVATVIKLIRCNEMEHWCSCLLYCLRRYGCSECVSLSCVGVHYPSLASLCSQKVVESERGFLMSTVGSGSYLGFGILTHAL